MPDKVCPLPQISNQREIVTLKGTYLGPKQNYNRWVCIDLCIWGVGLCR